MQRWYERIGFVVANMVVMIILHGNSRQFWPKIPYLSLRDESVAEHTRLLFNTLALVSLGQLALGRLTPARRKARLVTLIAQPLALPLLIWLGRSGLRLRGAAAERYNLAMVPLLPIAAIVAEEQLEARWQQE